jgi:soluble lytic murein transglycosylase-like protein
MRHDLPGKAFDSAQGLFDAYGVLDGSDFRWTEADGGVWTRTYSRRSGHGRRALFDDIGGVIDFHAESRGLSEALVKAVIRVESSGNPFARSRSGACGLMQLMPSTAAEMGVYNVFDPDENIAGGTGYLAKMLERFDGDKKLALAAYNAGPNAVRKYRGVPPYPETRKYIERVLRFEKYYASGRPFRLS